MVRKLLSITLLLIILFSATTSQAQVAKDTLTPKQVQNRVIGLSIGFGVAYTASLVMLNKAWYSQDTRSSFHFYDDLHHWNQMDKAGHFYTAFHQSRAGIDALRWAGVKEKKAIWIGGMMGIVLQTPIEIFDGFSAEYGASVSDFAANTLGSAGVIAQELTWGEIRIMPKFSFRPTPYDPNRLEMFGNSLPEQILQDYNGQSYWLSVDVAAFLKKDSRFPKWLNIAAGYGAGGMVYGDPVQNRLHGHQSYRQFFLSPDIDLRYLPVKSKFLKTAIYLLSMYRIPMPALEYNTRNQLRFHPLYY
ncbi:DUF2279 domain-containing protein [Litoribacter populi]|uniref:DUF2279 domain-containing protein n=1 Tax=Litoribacter populi TaxID=2598460 RepID=UPI00117FDD4F|nr:DUF2279 domain-containing protein [Litoribacter populi]